VMPRSYRSDIRPSRVHSCTHRSDAALPSYHLGFRSFGTAGLSRLLPAIAPSFPETPLAPSLGALQDQMKSTDFLAAARPRLASIKRFPKVEFADYERRLAEMQATLQHVQQAYLGTQDRAIIVLEGWDTAGKGGVVRRLGWALDPRSLKVHAIAAPTAREK